MGRSYQGELQCQMTLLIGKIPAGIQQWKKAILIPYLLITERKVWLYYLTLSVQ